MISLSTIKNNKKALVIGVLVILLVLGIVTLALFLQQKNKKTTQKGFTQQEIKIIQGKTVTLSQNAQKIRKDIISHPIRQNGGDKYLIQSREFTIIYVTTPDQFYVQINNEPVQDNKKLAEKWFTDKGLTQQELCGMGIHFELTTPGATKDQISNFPTATEGCPSL